MSLRFLLCNTMLWSYISTILNCIVMSNLCFAVGRILRWPPNDPHPYIILQPLSEEDTCVYIWWTITLLINMFYGAADWRKKLSQIGLIWCFLGSSVIKNLSASAGDPGSIPGSRRSPGEGNGNSLQYFCLENSMEGAWWATVYGVAKTRTRLNN